jgi:hypothetical protein
MVLEKKGEEFVRNLISEIFSKWGCPIDWKNQSTVSEINNQPKSEAS